MARKLWCRTTRLFQMDSAKRAYQNVPEPTGRHSERSEESAFSTRGVSRIVRGSQSAPISRYPGFLISLLLLVGCHRPDPDALNRELIDAAKNGDKAGVSRLLDNGADVETRNESGRTILMLAALKGNSQIVQVLLDRRAKVNTTDPD